MVRQAFIFLKSLVVYYTIDEHTEKYLELRRQIYDNFAKEQTELQWAWVSALAAFYHDFDIAKKRHMHLHNEGCRNKELQLLLRANDEVSDLFGMNWTNN